MTRRQGRREKTDGCGDGLRGRFRGQLRCECAPDGYLRALSQTSRQSQLSEWQGDEQGKRGGQEETLFGLFRTDYGGLRGTTVHYGALRLRAGTRSVPSHARTSRTVSPPAATPPRSPQSRTAAHHGRKPWPQLCCTTAARSSTTAALQQHGVRPAAVQRRTPGRRRGFGDVLGSRSHLRRPALVPVGLGTATRRTASTRLLPGQAQDPILILAIRTIPQQRQRRATWQETLASMVRLPPLSGWLASC